MPVLKAVSGHTRCPSVMRYLTRKNRALACDYLNLDAPVIGHADGLPTYGEYDWARAMDATRERYGNDLPWRGKRVRTYKHYILSPDPADRIGLAALRELAVSWAERHFPDQEVAIVYHDDNAGGIPHAHLVVNNTCLTTGRRLQVPDPKELNRSLQRMAAGRGLSAFDNADRTAPAPAGARAARRPPRTLQRVHASRAESELAASGRYSWVADIRARVDVARATAGSEAEFRARLAELGVTVSGNSPRARRPDWLYALADSPARRVSGEKLGLLYCRESLERRFAYGGPRLDAADRETVARIARGAVEVGDLAGLRALAGAVRLCDERAVRSVADLDRLVSRGEVDAADPAVAAARSAGFLPDRPRARRPPARQPAAAPARTRRASWSDRGAAGRQGFQRGRRQEGRGPRRGEER